MGELIPRRILFGNPDKGSPEVAPDGRRLAHLAPVDESHAIIQYRAVTQNLDAIADVLTALAGGKQVPSISVEGRESAVWGQPQLTAYLHWKSEARRKRHATRIPALS